MLFLGYLSSWFFDRLILKRFFIFFKCNFKFINLRNNGIPIRASDVCLAEIRILATSVQAQIPD